ncbi:MAG TPA: PucR family transcriptional regulator ligand-binding domain-containing protein [Actinomycetota bacterium]|nr:PucR family transcriptional regulator ligand-binding domain-containing protein [Actinomycetota bacterium]
MATTVADLLAIDELALTLVAGKQGVSRPIRWAHVSELKDPTRFLRGGEVLLTTGLGMRGGPGGQAGYVEQLAEARLAALGLGLGFAFKTTPPAVIAAADRAGFPVFEVPFEVPFIAITEALFSRLVNEQYVLLQRAGTVQQTLSRLLLEGAGLDALLGAYARMTGTRALLFDLHGEVAAAAPGAAAVLRPRAVWAEIQALRPEGNEFSMSLSDEIGSRSLLPILVGGSPAGFLVLHREDRPEPFHQVVVHHLATAIALELAKAQAVARTERRLVGDFLDALLEGELSADETRRRLRFLGLGHSPAVAVLVARAAAAPQRPLAAPDGATEALRRLVEDRLSRKPGPYVASVHDDLVVALFEAGDPAAARATAEAVAEGVLAKGVAARFGLGTPAGDPPALRRTYQEARFALAAAATVEVPTATGPGGPPVSRVASVEDLGSHRLLLALQEDAALEALSRGLLAPLRAYDQRQHGDLVASLRTFLEHNGNWEAAARALAVHRHTLRYRIRRVAELTGRDLESAADRVEFWLALQAADVLGGRGGRPA